MAEQVPVTVVTGYLGSGKTTIILNLIEQLDPGYDVVWLKNEYGDFSVDSELAKEENIEVKEMMNGCLCCVLVGKLGNAIEEILEDYSPDRIIIESSGTAYPLPIILELEKIKDVRIDGVINVIDAVNFTGYEDKGEVAIMQAKCTNLIIINKSDVEEEQLEQVKDEVYELNPGTPKILSPDGYVSKHLLLGLDQKLLDHKGLEFEQEHHHPDEVQVVTVRTHSHFIEEELLEVLEQLKNKDIIRIKAVIKLPDQSFEVVNWVYGNCTTHPLTQYEGESVLVFMGKNMKLTKKLIVDKLTQILQTDDQLRISETI